MTKSELLKYIDTMLTQRSDGNIGLLRVRQYVEDNMEDMPSVQRTGRWKQIFNHWHECSECGERTGVVNLNGEVVWNYCPNCGAEMKGEEE